MGFNNGYDSGYADALEDVRRGRVAGLRSASGGNGSASAPAPAFNAGVLEGYDVEKLLSSTDLRTYLASLSDTDIKALLGVDSASPLPFVWDNIRGQLPDVAGLTGVFAVILNTAYTRDLISGAE